MGRKTKSDDDVAITPEQLDRLTDRAIARAHVDVIFGGDDLGEKELVLQFFHLLHARRHSLAPDDVDTRRLDFEEQMKLLWEGS